MQACLCFQNKNTTKLLRQILIIPPEVHNNKENKVCAYKYKTPKSLRKRWQSNRSFEICRKRIPQMISTVFMR